MLTCRTKVRYSKREAEPRSRGRSPETDPRSSSNLAAQSGDIGDQVEEASSDTAQSHAGDHDCDAPSLQHTNPTEDENSR